MKQIEERGYTGYVELKGAANEGYRINFITTLLNNAESKVNHFDGLRQRNLTIALAIFAGMFAFTMQSSNDLRALSTSVALTVLMIIFFILDHRIDKYSSGWQETRTDLIESLQTVINDPEKDIKFLKYNKDGERNANLLGWKSILHFMLVIGGVISYFVFRWAK